MKRYTKKTFYDAVNEYDKMVEDPEGEYVKYEDVKDNIVNPNDLRNYEGNYCICIHCQKDVVTVAVVGASWPRECPNCKALGLYKFKQSGEPPNYRQVEKCCYTCAHQSHERCNKYNRPITYDFICDDWYYTGNNDA